jgi:hypothetical protein
VISADWDEECIESILHAADYNNIKYYEIPMGTVLKVRGYSGNENLANLEDVQSMNFENGAYLFPMAQDSGNALAMLMEPDVHRTDSFGISFVQSKMLIVSEVFRSELNLVGGIVPADAQTINTLDCATSIAMKFAAGTASSLVFPAMANMFNK